MYMCYTTFDLFSLHVQVQKSAVLQKTIDYIRYLENSNRKLREENKQLRTIIGSSQGNTRLRPLNEIIVLLPYTGTCNGYPLDSVGNSPLFQTESSGDEYHSTSPDVFLSVSGNYSPVHAPLLVVMVTG